MSSSRTAGALVPVDTNDTTYSRLVRTLHWLMAAGFVAMWVTGVLVVNVEGVPAFVEEDRQGVVRDLHKSIGLTLALLLVVRLFARVIVPPPALPASIPAADRRLAHLGHGALYASVVLATVTGLAIADLQDFGNAYFGIPLPKLFPTVESVGGFAVDPWSYAAHGLVAYGLLALVLVHVAAVGWHRRRHAVDLLGRVTALAPARASAAYRPLAIGALVVALLVFGFAIRAHTTVGPMETPRDYTTTTPFAR